MTLSDYSFDGSRRLVLRDMPTGAGSLLGEKERLTEKTKENMVQAALLQERMYASRTEGLVFALQARDAAGKAESGCHEDHLL